MDEIKELPLEEYFKNNSDKENNFIELFEATNENVDLRTDLSIGEILILNAMRINSQFLKERINYPLYNGFIDSYLRLKISLDRKSRIEFVDINKRDRTKDKLQDLSNFKNLSEVKK